MLRRIVVAGLVSAAACGCGGGSTRAYPHVAAAGGPSSRIEERALSERPLLSVIGRQGDPETAVAFASLASASPELHAAWGEVLRDRWGRAGFAAQLVTHGLGFELMLLVEDAARARAATQALLRALTQAVGVNELEGAAPSAGSERAAASAVAQCSAELGPRPRITSVQELERDRVESFASDRAALAVVGNEAIAAAVADALSAGPDWPERGRVRSTLPQASVTQVLRGERATLSVALTAADANRVLGATALLGDAKSALGVRLAALGGGLRLRRVTATAHPLGACLRIDSDVDASPVPDARRLGFAIQLMQEEAGLALARAPEENRLEATALSASDPRLAARAAAYHALLAPAPSGMTAQLVALTAPDEAPLAPSIEAAVEQARAETPPLDLQVRVEAGQPGIWALLATPCAAAHERADNAGYAAVLLGAASAATPEGVRLEPWIGAEGAGLLGFTERGAGESTADAAARLGEALGQAALAPPAAVDVATARAELLKELGGEPRPLLEGVFETLAPGHGGALTPRGTESSLQAASREAVVLRQRELLRLPHRLAILSPTNQADASFVARSLSRWLKSPDPTRPSACGSEISGPSRGELSLPAGSSGAEGSYLAFRIPGKAGNEAMLLAELLNLPGGALARTLAEPDLAGAARALVFGTHSARALIVQISAFEGREADALSRVQKLFERLSSGGVLVPAEVDAALARRRAARRSAALDPRYRLVQLLDPSVAQPVDAAALRRLTASLRPETAVVARSGARFVTPPPKR